jgi:hemoglobin
MADLASRNSPYQRLGGEEGIRRLVKVFYDTVETHPEGAPLMVMHNQGNGLAQARAAQFEFLSGFFGGPQLYVEHHGHSNVKTIHEHLEIGAVERDSWLNCMDMALAQFGAEPQLHRQIMAHFRRVAEALRTKP